MLLLVLIMIMDAITFAKIYAASGDTASLKQSEMHFQKCVSIFHLLHAIIVLIMIILHNHIIVLFCCIII